MDLIGEMVGETCSFSRKKKSLESFYAKGDILSGMTAEIDIVDERSHVRFGKKWIPILYKQKFGDAKLEELIKQAMIPPKKRVKTKATRGSRERRLDGKKKNSAKKKDRGKIHD